AFEYLLDRYQSQLVRLALQYVPSRAIAEEVVQDTWLAVIKGIDRFEGRSSLKTWLFRVMVNIARTRGVREQRAIPFASVTDDDHGGNDPAVPASRFRRFGRAAGTWKRPPVAWPEAEQRALDEEATRFVHAAIDGLPPAQREVITMRDVLGWSSADVCAALDLADGNQRVLLHRARSKVRASLERRYAEDGVR
ncbi:MAG TPA: RNA polymerase sigma factor, partial [Acidimicrobiia bacterium]